MDSKDPISVIDDIPGGTTEKYRKTFDRPGTIESLRLRNYVGHEFDLRYRPYLLTADGSRINLIKSLGREFVAGNNDIFEVDVRTSFQQDDELVIEVENNDPNRIYHANAIVSVDYAGGGASWIADAIKGVF